MLPLSETVFLMLLLIILLVNAPAELDTGTRTAFAPRAWIHKLSLVLPLPVSPSLGMSAVCVLCLVSRDKRKGGEH